MYLYMYVYYNNNISIYLYHILYTSFLAGSFTCRTTTKIYAESYIHDLLYISNTFMTGIPRFLYFRIREKVESTNEHRPEHSVSVSSDVSVANPTANQTLAGIE